MRDTQIVIPNDVQERVLAIAHEGQPGIVAMKNKTP